MKEYYELKKVVDPHQHMPKNIRGYLLDGMRYRELNNDSFIHWTVGEYKDEYDAEPEEDEEYESDPDDLEYEEDEEFDEYDGEDDYEQSVELLAKVDAFLLKHFKKGEEIIILYWW